MDTAALNQTKTLTIKVSIKHQVTLDYPRSTIDSFD